MFNLPCCTANSSTFCLFQYLQDAYFKFAEMNYDSRSLVQSVIPFILFYDKLIAKPGCTGAKSLFGLLPNHMQDVKVNFKYWHHGLPWG